jgi:hypothetical protein
MAIIVLLMAITFFYLRDYPEILDYSNAVNNNYISYAGIPLSIERHYEAGISVDIDKQVNEQDGIYAIRINTGHNDVLLRLVTDSYIPFHYGKAYKFDYLPNTHYIIRVDENTN